MVTGRTAGNAGRPVRHRLSVARARPGRLENPTAAAKYALRSLACRYLQLDKEARELQAELERLTQMAAPALVSAFGVGPDTATTLLISAGRNAFAPRLPSPPSAG